MRDLGAELVVNYQAALLVSLEANVFQTETSGIGSASNGNKYDIGVKLQQLAYADAQAGLTYGFLLTTFRGFHADGNV